MPANHRACPGTRPETAGPLALSAPTSPIQDAPDARAGATLDSLISVPGVPATVAVARRLVRAALAGSPRCDDIELVTSELLTNAICHSGSGEEGSPVTIRIRAEDGWVRIEVTDRGNASWAEPTGAGEDEERGRGLAIVHTLADKAGHEPAAGGQVSWAEIHWDAGPALLGVLRPV
jgi:anti-sigma regulatory factor (Ser/Thr protein kinase)